MRSLGFALVLSAWFAGTALAAVDAAWRVLPAAVPADSLVTRLRSLELRPTAAVGGGEAAFALGQLHYARGEYRQASDAFARAGGRLAGEERGEARYWSGLTALALGEPAAARVAFGEASASRRALAQLGTAFAWDQEQRPEKAYEQLRVLLGGNAGEATAPALDRLAQLAARLGHRDEAAAARLRLAREFPGTVEAARTAATPLGPPPPVQAAPATRATRPLLEPVSVQVGAFADEARARSLAEQARRAGFPEAEVVKRRTAEGSALWVVRLGRYPDRAEAARAGDRVQRALGIGWQVEKP